MKDLYKGSAGMNGEATSQSGEHFTVSLRSPDKRVKTWMKIVERLRRTENWAILGVKILRKWYKSVVILLRNNSISFQPRIFLSCKHDNVYFNAGTQMQLLNFTNN